MTTKISGINGTNNILSSQAKLRKEKGMINSAVITKVEDGYIVRFDGKNAEWNNEKLALCSSRSPYEPRVFKSIDGAASEIERIGISEISLELTTIDLP
ncbi:hypothetical protein MVR12_005656 [Escherichia coli]|nr:hypothetical protein [Escherichia coli]HEI8402951.1 hypothetical protein [Citrobacter freundii]